MAKTIEQYMSKTQVDYGSGVEGPKIKDKDNFELKGQFLKELRTNTFSGSNHEDANEHIEKVLEIVDLFHIPNLTIDQVILRAFYMSLIGATSHWLKNKPSGIQAQLNNLGREIKKVNEKVYVAQVGCEQCKGPHYTKDFLLKEEGKTLEEVDIEELLWDSTKGTMQTLHTKNEDKKGSYGPQFSEGYSYGAPHIDKSIPQKEIEPGSFTLSCAINNVCFNYALADLGASDIKVPLILERPFLPTAHAKIDVFQNKITLRVGEEKIIFKSIKLAKKLRRDQFDDLMPTIEEGEVVKEFRARNNARMVSKFFGYPSDYDHDKKVHINCAYNLKFSCMIGIQGKHCWKIFYLNRFCRVLEDMDAYRDDGMGDVIFGELFLEKLGLMQNGLKE
nr:hypothetical protein [Tanacetum cinerariifolium]